MSNGCNQDQAQQVVGPNQGPNCLQIFLFNFCMFLSLKKSEIPSVSNRKDPDQAQLFTKNIGRRHKQAKYFIYIVNSEIFTSNLCLQFAFKDMFATFTFSTGA